MPGSDGNLSIMLGKDEILITPSRLCKGYLEPHHIIKVDHQGNRLEGDLPPTSEIQMHLAAYQERDDICAVAHCHPPRLVAFTVAGQTLPTPILPEIEVLFGGEIPLAPYATPGGKDLADSMRDAIKRSTLVLLDHHGVISVSGDLFMAAIKIEHAEAAAKIIYYARQLGGERSLPPESVEILRAAHHHAQEVEAQIFPPTCRVSLPTQSPRPASDTSPSLSDNELESKIREIIDRIKVERS